MYNNYATSILPLYIKIFCTDFSLPYSQQSRAFLLSTIFPLLLCIIMNHLMYECRTSFVPVDVQVELTKCSYVSTGSFFHGISSSRWSTLAHRNLGHSLNFLVKHIDKRYWCNKSCVCYHLGIKNTITVTVVPGKSD